jgi:hypothetical protein
MHQQSRDGVGYSRGVDHLASLSKGAVGGHLYRFLLMPLANDLERWVWGLLTQRKRNFVYLAGRCFGASSPAGDGGHCFWKIESDGPHLLCFT